MKIFRKLSHGFLPLILLLVLLAPAGRGETVEWFDFGEEVVTSEGSGTDGAALLDRYVGNLFGTPAIRLRKRGTQPLTGVNKVIYDRLVPFIQDVAAGNITATETTIELSLSDLGLSRYEWSASDLGIGSMVENGMVTAQTPAAVKRLLGYDISLIMGCLQAEHPYEMYWYDQENGYVYTYPGRVIGKNGAYYVTFENCSMRFSFRVARDFAKKGYDDNGNSIYYYYKTDPAMAQTAVRAAENARRIVAKNADKSNYEKLNAYRQEITDLASYNNAAWSNGAPQMPYGNPWQLVWVFDGDPATRVVCEGYAKAFQYLCDQSSFKGDVNCITAYGTVNDGSKAEGHAWNIVHMNNGRNYLVDVTICDSLSMTKGSWLFMAGYSTKPSSDQYVFRFGSRSFAYVYNADMSKIYPASALQISNAPFNPVAVGLGITPGNFPDANFRAYVSSEFDEDGDGALSAAEIRGATDVFVSYMDIATLTGIEHLTALELLSCSGNRLTSLNLSGNPLLDTLACDENQLASLDLSGNTELYSVSCWGNKLTSLNVSKNAALHDLNCAVNQLSSLNVSKNAALVTLDCSENKLTALNVANNSALVNLHCQDNKLTSLNVRQNAALGSLECGKNLLDALDVTRNPGLEKLECNDNRIGALNVRRNPRLFRLRCQGNSLKELDIANCPKLVDIARESNANLRYDSDVTLNLYDDILCLPAGLTIIEPYAFEGVAADVVEIPEGCVLIFGGAFANCPNLKEVRFPAACEASLHANTFGDARPIIVTASPTIQEWAGENGFTWALE